MADGADVCKCAIRLAGALGDVYFFALKKLNQSIASTEKRLGNEEFVKSAPAHVVEGAQSQLAANRNERSVLLENLAMLGAKV